MLVFLDESGDTGWKQDAGSSQYFLVSLALFENHEEADCCDKAICKLRETLNLPQDYEFHFTNNSRKTRLAFLKTITPFSFSVITIAIRKDADSTMAEIYKKKNAFYRYACHTVLNLASPYLDRAIIIMDKGNTDTFYGELRRSLRQRLDDRERMKIKKIKPQDSKHNNLLQLVDYMAGASSRKIQGKKDWQEYYSYVSTKEIFCQELPEK